MFSGLSFEQFFTGKQTYFSKCFNVIFQVIEFFAPIPDPLCILYKSVFGKRNNILLHLATGAFSDFSAVTVTASSYAIFRTNLKSIFGCFFLFFSCARFTVSIAIITFRRFVVDRFLVILRRCCCDCYYYIIILSSIDSSRE